jgi:ABC-type multidrug transport system fused ATPase/permease subunit
LNAIKIVFAFGREKNEMENYDKYLTRARNAGVKTHMLSGLAIGLLMTMVNIYFSYSFYVGSYFVTDEKWNAND